MVSCSQTSTKSETTKEIEPPNILQISMIYDIQQLDLSLARCFIMNVRYDFKANIYLLSEKYGNQLIDEVFTESEAISKFDESSFNLSIHKAVQNDNFQESKRIIDSSFVNINEKDVSHLTALHIAIIKDNLLIAEELLKSGASPNEADGVLTWTPLHWACQQNNNNEMVLLLLKFVAFLLFLE